MFLNCLKTNKNQNKAKRTFCLKVRARCVWDARMSLSQCEEIICKMSLNLVSVSKKDGVYTESFHSVVQS